MKQIDIRSDTVTIPTQKMRIAMRDAPVGDDYFGEDPTVNALQELAAKLLGKQAALFTPSGLMSNQLGIMSSTNHGDQVIAWQNAHIIDHQTAALVVLSGVQTRLVPSITGILQPYEIQPLIRKQQGLLYPKTSLILLENSLSNGKVWPLQNLKKVRQLANKYKIKIHIDGARLFNAKTSLNCQVTQITQYADSISFCLSKGLCCPIGSLLVGSKELIQKAKFFRKSIGGGMRQAGLIAAAGIVALNQMIEPLKEDHRIARYIGQELSKIQEIDLDFNYLQANMVFFKLKNKNLTETGLQKHLLQNNIRMSLPYEPFFNYRIACHHYIRQIEADLIIEKIREYIERNRSVL